MELRGYPFLSQVVKKMPGWYLLGAWNETTFNFHDTLNQVHVDFWTPAFFNVFINTDGLDWNKKVIQVCTRGVPEVISFDMKEQH